MDIQQSNDGGLRELALFAGAGGGILGGHLLGWRTVVAVERDAYAAQVLAQRQNDGILKPFPIWSDVTTFDGRPWKGRIDVISGGFPCQDISAAGKGAGINGERSGMWKHMARIIGEVLPELVYVENSPMLTSRGLGVVLGDLAEMGFDAEWGVISAADTGAPHLRERIWIVAHAMRVGYIEPTTKQLNSHHRERIAEACQQGRQPFADEIKPGDKNVAHSHCSQCQGNERAKRAQSEHSNACAASGWPIEPDVGRVANGVAHRMDRLKAIGNGQVPRVAAAAWRILGGS